MTIDPTTTTIMNTMLYSLIQFLFGYIGIVSTLAALIAVHQERNIWKPPLLPSLSYWGGMKVFFYNIMWMFSCIIGILCIVLKWIVSLGSSDLEYDSNRWVENIAAQLCTYIWIGRVHIEGMEHLKDSMFPLAMMTSPKIPAPIFIANHASQLDVGATYFLGQRFKWIAKQSVYYLPGVGQVMWLGGHVMIDRRTGKNTKSVSTLFTKSNEAIQSGIPMFLFPQGTRRIAERLPFKNGAFIMAQSNASPLIPLSIDIPYTNKKNIWNSAYPLNQLWGGTIPVITITVHPPIPVTGQESMEELKQKCEDVIYSVLPVPVKMETSKDK